MSQDKFVNFANNQLNLGEQKSSTWTYKDKTHTLETLESVKGNSNSFYRIGVDQVRKWQPVTGTAYNAAAPANEVNALSKWRIEYCWKNK